MSSNDRAKYVALSGGIGGAKLSLGLAQLLGDRLTVIVNTGDDFEHLGLYVSPDVDTTLYTLGGVVNPDTGWGRADETWSFMQALRRARRADLVQARRPRSRHACGAHAAPRRRRDADRHHPAFGPQAGHCRAHPANG